ncbi:TonB-dependent receptor [Altererythrobacter sp. CC-YST694]|uniref:TonB-dependent receptor domain-containing protein n=1 Tax=Altererythrobacter sp. CC-YST694 TaxID=2755038 RepID=UPI001D01DC38|nr:TonB-dependent receptor [Altererythrobacter sp. CC-YST694]MCB5426544.1 TonB-dependent receptor [Altererythrobacter sp. CC-YST694]
MKTRSASLLAAASLLVPYQASFAAEPDQPIVQAAAQDAAQNRANGAGDAAATSAEAVQPAASGRPGDDYHGEILVTAPGLARLDMLAGTSVMSGTELQRNLGAGTLGDVLARVPGVSSTSFAPGVSRPVLRGFTGERVRVLNDGIGSIDAASTSADHAVTIDPLLTDRIEVLRGPAVLLYGSQAIGGAVNVIGKRIPPRVPDEAVHIDALAAADTAADRREIGSSVDVPLASNVAFHIDGSWRKSGDVQVPGYVASKVLRAEMLAAADEEQEEGHLDEAAELRDGANTRGRIPNSQTETTSLGTGIAFFSGESNFGVSFGYFDTSYGIPGLPGVGHVHEHEEGGEEEGGHEEEGPVTIGMKQYRVDLRGVLDLGDGFFDKVQTRWGWSDYTHTEFEGGATGTRFDVSGIEGRLELVQSQRGGWGGSLGAQYSHQDFNAIGEEAFVPPSTTDSFALFTTQELDLAPFELEAGGRYERTDIDVASLNEARSFDSFSGALGLSYNVTPGLRIGINGSRAERAPSVQELFADGPHVATQQYEVGNLDLTKEGAWGLEGYLRGNLGDATVSFSVYHNWFDGFIFLSETGTEEDGLPIYEFLQQDARHFGLEGEISAPLYQTDGFKLLADLRGDYVRATLADGSPVPRIPPLSLTGALEAHIGDFDARAEVEWYDKQDRLAPLETPTGSFAFTNLSFAWHPLTGTDNLTFMLQADNIFDVEGRRHASFTKDFVPLTGRNFRLSVKASF